MSAANDAFATTGRTEFSFDSADGKSQVRAVLWVPLAMERADAAAGEPSLGCFKPRGVVQLVHGMAEHIDRYDDFARFLADAGYLVAGHDHIGHGDQAAAPECRGVIGAEGGADAMIDDVEQLRLLVSQQVAPGTPYFIFGHSMGSLVLRSYLPRYGQGLAGAVICGTANEATAVSRAGNLAARAIAAVRGDGYRSGLLHALADGAYSRAIKDARTPFDWLSRDPAVPDAFMADEACGFMFGAGAYATLTELAWRAAAPATFGRHAPRLAPALRGRRRRPRRQMRPRCRCRRRVHGGRWRRGQLALRLFPGMRHEILNEFGKEEVYDFILNWINLHE